MNVWPDDSPAPGRLYRLAFLVAGAFIIGACVAWRAGERLVYRVPAWSEALRRRAWWGALPVLLVLAVPVAAQDAPEAPVDPELHGRAELVVTKQRNGELGTANVLWDGQTTRFYSAEQPNPAHPDPVQAQLPAPTPPPAPPPGEAPPAPQPQPQPQPQPEDDPF